MNDISLPEIEIIIPTTCESKRWRSLLRAISSITSQEQVRATVIVVVNGDRIDGHCHAQLKVMSNVKLFERAEGSAPKAQHFGRTMVTADYFGFLDDDDEFLPHTLHERIKPLIADSQLDFVVCNGYKTIDGNEGLAVTRPGDIQESPLRALIYENWLASCAGLFRTKTISAEYFQFEIKYFEWTVLAYKLAINRRMVFIAHPGYRINDSENSLSKSSSYRGAEVGVIEQILKMPLPRDIQRSLKIKLGKAFHSLSEENFSQGNIGAAWKLHIKSLAQPKGSAFLLYTRKLLRS